MTDSLSSPTPQQQILLCVGIHLGDSLLAAATVEADLRRLLIKLGFPADAIGRWREDSLMVVAAGPVWHHEDDGSLTIDMNEILTRLSYLPAPACRGLVIGLYNDGHSTCMVRGRDFHRPFFKTFAMPLVDLKQCRPLQMMRSDLMDHAWMRIFSDGPTQPLKHSESTIPLSQHIEKEIAHILRLPINRRIPAMVGAIERYPDICSTNLITCLRGLS